MGATTFNLTPRIVEESKTSTAAKGSSASAAVASGSGSGGNGYGAGVKKSKRRDWSSPAPPRAFKPRRGQPESPGPAHSVEEYLANTKKGTEAVASILEGTGLCGVFGKPKLAIVGTFVFVWLDGLPRYNVEMKCRNVCYLRSWYDATSVRDPVSISVTIWLIGKYSQVD